MYRSVVERSAWPSISCTERRSAPPSSRWVANEWRRRCGWTRSGSSPALPASRRRMRKAPARVSAPPWALRKSSGRWRLSRIRPAAGEVAAQRLDGLAPDRDDALLGALAEAADEPLLEIDAGALEPDRLAHAQARAVEQLDERPVAERARAGADGRLDQALGLAGRERPRQRAPAARQLELGRRIVGARAEQHLVAVEGADRRDAARDRRRRAARGAQRRDVAGEVVRGRVGRRPAEEGREVGEVAPVRVDGPRREPRRGEREEAVDGGVVHSRVDSRWGPLRLPVQLKGRRATTATRSRRGRDLVAAVGCGAALTTATWLQPHDRGCALS